MANAKLRHKDLKQFSKEAFEGTRFFKDIVEIKSTVPCISASTKAFCITFLRNLNEFQRTEIETILFSWFNIGPNLQHQGIVCWREGELIIYIF